MWLLPVLEIDATLTFAPDAAQQHPHAALALITNRQLMLLADFLFASRLLSCFFVFLFFWPPCLEYE